MGRQGTEMKNNDMTEEELLARTKRVFDTSRLEKVIALIEKANRLPEEERE